MAGLPFFNDPFNDSRKSEHESSGVGTDDLQKMVRKIGEMRTQMSKMQAINPKVENARGSEILKNLNEDFNYIGQGLPKVSDSQQPSQSTPKPGF
ncbi:MAG: hypothetical protein H0T84_09300 [Tatlockia sp.]|nr:hypothetical protein [Tatlockia sp.]